VSNNSLNHHLHANLSTPATGGNGGCGSSGGGYHSPSHPQLHDQQQLLVPHPQLTPGGDDGGISSDCSDDEGSPQDPSHMPVVYPWMKKIHVGGSGKSSDTFLTLARRTSGDQCFDFETIFEKKTLRKYVL
jgi:hypothetical protein